MKIIRRSYNGQPLRDTYFAFVVIWLNVESREVIEYFEKNYKEKGWNVSLAKMSARDESPKRRKNTRRNYAGDEYELKPNNHRFEQWNNRFNGNFRGREDYGDIYREGRVGEDYRDMKYNRSNERKKSEEMDNPRYYSSSQKDSYEDGRNMRHVIERKQPEPEKRIPCNSSSLQDPEAFARLLLLPSDVIQNVILQLANNNKQALVGIILLRQHTI